MQAFNSLLFHVLDNKNIESCMGMSVTSNENLHVNYNLLRYTIDINHPYLVFNVTAWCQIWLNVVFIELLEFADV